MLDAFVVIFVPLCCLLDCYHVPIVLPPCFSTVDTMLKSATLMPPSQEIGAKRDCWVGFLHLDRGGGGWGMLY